MILALAAALALAAPDSSAPVGVAPSAIPDRSAPPEVAPAAPMDLPAWQEHSPWPGMRVLLVPVGGVRKVDLVLTRHRGTLDLDGGPGAAAHATGWLQDVAAGDRSADELAVFEDLHDLDVWSGAPGPRRSELGLVAPREALDEGLALLGDVARDPSYPRREIRRYARDQRVHLTTTGPASPAEVASAARAYGWYDADHPYGVRPDLRALRRLGPRQLRARHRALRDAPVTLLVVGDLSWEELEPLLHRRLAGLGGEGDEGLAPEVVPPPGTRLLAVDVPGAEQAVVRLRMPAPDPRDPDADAFSVVDWAWGGHFLSRINANLREARGLTYGAGSRYVSEDRHGHWDVGFEVGAEHVGVAIEQVGAEMDRVVAEGLTPPEIDACWRDRVRDWNVTLATATSASSRYAAWFEAREDVDVARQRLDRVATLTPEHTRDVAARWWAPERARLWVVVGDRATLDPQLAEVGLTPHWLAPDDALLGVIPSPVLDGSAP